MNRPTRLFVIECAPGSNLASRWEKTLRVAREPQYYWLPNPESPAHPQGTSMQAVLRKMAQPHRTDCGQHSHELTPEHYRALRAVMHEYKKTRQPIHIVGMLDAHSPFGTWHQTEGLARYFHDAGVEVVLHVGVWHPTPSELKQHMQELIYWQSPYVTLGSLFPMTHQRAHDVSHYFSQLADTSVQANEYTILPLSRIHRYHDSLPDEGATILVTDGMYAPSVSPYPMVDGIQRVYKNTTSPSDRIKTKVDTRKHLMVLTSRPSYEEAFMGDEITHPYYERWAHHSPTELMELYISPQFGYHTEPQHTYAFLHDEPKKPLDSMVSHALKHSDEPFACCFIQPDKLNQNLVVTNVPLNKERNLYYELADNF